MTHIPILTESDFLTDDEKWPSFHDDAEHFFGAPPSPQTAMKLKRLFLTRKLGPADLEAFRYLFSLDVRYPVRDWAGNDFRPLFRAGSVEPLRQFVPSSFRQFAAKPAMIREYVLTYLEHHRSVLEADLSTIDINLDLDRYRFRRAFSSIHRSGSDVIPDLCYVTYKAHGPDRCPAWPIIEWISVNVPEPEECFLEAIAELRAIGRTELLPFAPKLDRQLLACFGIAEPSVEESRDWRDSVEEYEAKIREVERIQERLLGSMPGQRA